jgi:type VI secretion system protein ImpC
MTKEQQPEQVAVEEAPAQEISLTLDDVISATPQTEPDRAKALLRTFVDEAMEGTVTWDKNLTVTFRKAIAEIDSKISEQLAAVMHAPEFSRLEGTWRGLNHLVMNTETSSMLKIRVLDVRKRELFKDFDKAVEFDQSQLFKKLYTNEFGMPGGQPYGAIIGDFEFTNHPEDVELLRHVAGVSAAAFAPFLSAASPKLFGFDNWTELNKPRDLEKIFDQTEYVNWRSYRDRDDARFVALTMPRALARLPYGSRTKPVDEFNFEEAPVDASGALRAAAHDSYCWMNAAYVLGARMTDAFSKYGWCTAIRGVEGGGKVENLPTYIFTSDEGDSDMKCPTEVPIPDRRDGELSRLGFLPLCHYKNENYAAFFGAQTTQKPKKYDRMDANANAEISARLPYIMATSRFAHYLKVMGRDKIGAFMEASDVEAWLNRWIINYVSANPEAGQEIKAKYPLAAAKVEVKEVPGMPGSYNAVAWLRPWLQMEELTAALRLVARIPEKGRG